MSDLIQSRDLAARLTQTGAAMGRIAQDSAVFNGLVTAFRADNAERFSAVLDRYQLRPFCYDICRWFCSKECVLRCIDLAGLPETQITADQIPRFAQAIAKITGDKALVQRLADAVEKADANVFGALVKELQIQPFAQLLCHWACAVRCRLRCQIVCEPRPFPPKQFAGELALAGAAIARLAKDSRLKDVISAAIALNCELLTGVLGGFSDCVLICEWICSWRCALVCLPLCAQFPPNKDTSVAEILGFAQFSGQLAASKDGYPRLLASVEAQDAQAFGILIREFKAERYCLQLCHWLCYEICRRFCFCVCPEPETIPLFTHVGNYHVAPYFVSAADPAHHDFAADGATTDHGFAFSTTVDLKGILPDGTAPDALEYRFTFRNLSGGGTNPITGPMIPGSTVIGQLEYWEFNGAGWVPGSHDFFVNNPGAQAVIPQQFPPGSSLTVDVNVNADPNGWIQVPRLNELFNGGHGRFVPTGVLAQLDTTKLTNEVFDLTVAAAPLPLKAGDSIPPAQRSVKPVFQITFEARKVGVPLPLVGTNTLPKIALSNTLYTYRRHPDWAGSPPLPPTSSFLVLSLDIVELMAGGGCNPLTNDLHALFTAYHPYLATCQVYIEGPAPLPPAVNPPISALGEADSPVGGQAFNISALHPCAYILWLTGTLNLTNGYVQLYGTFDDHIAFCKQ